MSDLDWKGGFTVTLTILLVLLKIVKTFAMGLLAALLIYGTLSLIEGLVTRFRKKRVRLP